MSSEIFKTIEHDYKQVNNAFNWLLHETLATKSWSRKLCVAARENLDIFSKHHQTSCEILRDILQTSVDHEGRLGKWLEELLKEHRLVSRNVKYIQHFLTTNDLSMADCIAAAKVIDDILDALDKIAGVLEKLEYAGLYDNVVLDESEEDHDQS